MGQLTNKLASAGVTAQQKTWFADNLGSGDVQGHLNQLDPATARQVGGALKHTFIYALTSSMKLSTAVAAGRRGDRPGNDQPRTGA